MNEKVVYMDTNVLNDMAYLVNKDFVFKRMKERGYVLAISEVNILEILRDRSDLYNIDKMVIMLQELDEVILLPGLSQVIYNYLTQEDDFELPKDNVICDVLNNRDKEFIIDEESEKRIKDQKKLYKHFNKMINAVKNKKKCNECNSKYCTNNINELSKALAIIFLVYGIQLILPFDKEKYWNKLGISKEKDKIKYIEDNEDFIVKSDASPFRTMSKFALLQNGKNNGTFNDCLHSCYFQFADIIVSKDKHFLNNASRCISYEEFMKKIDILIIYENN